MNWQAPDLTVEFLRKVYTENVLNHQHQVLDVQTNVDRWCPACGSHKLSPQRGFDSEFPETEWERPTCDKCEWVGDAVPVFSTSDAYRSEGEDRPPPDGDCLVPTVPLRTR